MATEYSFKSNVNVSLRDSELRKGVTFIKRRTRVGVSFIFVFTTSPVSWL